MSHHPGKQAVLVHSHTLASQLHANILHLRSTLSSCSSFRIENAIPGRDTFDVEIYGMEGIPPADLAAWRKRQEEEQGGTQNGDQSNRPKRARYLQVALTPAEAKAQLAQHKALMSGKPLPIPMMMMPPPGQGPNGMYPPPPMMHNMMPPGGPGYGPPPMGFSMPLPMPGQQRMMPPPPPGFIPPPAGMPFPPPPGGMPFGAPGSFPPG